MGGFVGHFEGRTAFGQHRYATGAGMPFQADEAVGWPGGEAVGEVFLFRGEDVDGVMTGATKGFEVG